MPGAAAGYTALGPEAGEKDRREACRCQEGSLSGVATIPGPRAGRVSVPAHPSFGSRLGAVQGSGGVPVGLWEVGSPLGTPQLFCALPHWRPSALSGKHRWELENRVLSSLPSEVGRLCLDPRASPPPSFQPTKGQSSR